MTDNSKKSRGGRPRKVPARSPAARVIARRYSAGEPTADIAADFGLSKETVRIVAVREGRKPRPVGRPRTQQ